MTVALHRVDQNRDKHLEIATGNTTLSLRGGNRSPGWVASGEQAPEATRPVVSEAGDFARVTLFRTYPAIGSPLERM